MGRSTVLRAVTGVAWVFVGLALTYGALYLFTPFGLPIIVGCHLVGRALATINTGHVYERAGFIAAPGVGCLITASRAADATPWTIVGVALIAIGLLGYALARTLHESP